MPAQETSDDADALVSARGWRTALIVTAAATAIRLVLAAMLPLFPDETYYWDWSRHLSAGYFDHPPAISVLIAAGTHLAALAGAARSRGASSWVG